MRKLGIILLLVVLISCGNNQNTKQPEAQTLTDSVSSVPVNDKELFSGYLNDSYADLEKEVSGLSDAQLNFKPAADKWSVRETLEHIVLTEPMLFGALKETMVQPTSPERKTEVKKDDEVIAGILDRSNKVQAPEELVPSGKFQDAESALAELKKNREEFTKYADSISLEDLRNHVFDAPNGGYADAYQFLLYIPGHTMRHTLQIEEIKSDSGFPKE